MARYFILRGEMVVEEPDYSVWAEWYEALYEKVRCIASDQLHHCTVSTDFLAMSMGLNTGAPPLIFETRVRGGWLDDESERYATLNEARLGHQRWLERIRAADEENGLPPPGAGW
jgi:hypothetical protein